MKIVSILLATCLLAVGCVTTEPTISKSSYGNLELNVLCQDQSQTTQAEVYIDGFFIGNANDRMPVIYAKRGLRTIRIVCPGYKTYERQITILGDPNHQVLNVILENNH